MSNPLTEPWAAESAAKILGDAERLIFQAQGLVELAFVKLSAGNVEARRLALEVKQLRRELEHDLFHARDLRGRANRGGA